MMVPGMVIFRLLALAALVLFIFSARSKIKILRTAKKADRFNRWGERVKGVLLFMFGQRKLFYDPAPGFAHAVIFWGFCIISLESLQFFAGAFGWPHRLPLLHGPFYAIYEALCAGVLLSVLFALVRRYVLRVRRLLISWESFSVLLLIFILVSTGLLMNITAEISSGDPDPWKFVTHLLLPLFSGLSTATSALVYQVAWWVHGLVFLAFLNLLPHSKHMHVLTVVFNVFFRNLEPRGRLPKTDLENSEKLGVNDFADFTWKDVLDGYTCTECGRCTERCPANHAGKNLDPRSIILDFRDYARKCAKLAPGMEAPSIIEAPITKKDLWDCTTCHACVSACPVENEHLSKIIGMRQRLVMMDGSMPDEFQTTFKNLENNQNPWGMPRSARGDWAKELGLPRLAEHPEAEYLLFMGCAGCYDERAKKIIRSLTVILKKAGVSFAVLGEEEMCCGDIARRMGNEYLFQQMAAANVEVLAKYKVKKIIATDPHCFSSLKNEYGDFGIELEVFHHTEIIDRLLRDNKLRLNGAAAGATAVTVHDSCYLGRYNGIYEEPRRVLGRLDLQVAEMPNRKRNSYCCGGGGGRMWLEEDKGHRLNEARVKEALATGAGTIVTACPFCALMFADGVKTAGSSMLVSDLAEVVEARLA